MASVILKMLSSRPAVDMTMRVRQGCGNTAKYDILVAKKCLDAPTADQRHRGFSEHSMNIDIPYFSAAHNF